MRTRALAGLALVLLSSLPGAPKAGRDWAKYPAVAEVDTDEDIFVFGDVHGDYNRLLNLLNTAGIVSGRPADPEAVEWAAGKAVVVFVGDMMDKGKHSLKVLRLVRALRDAASRKGGQVIALMGNHEAEFLADPGNRKAEAFVQELQNANLNAVDVAACRGDLGQFLCSLPFAARVGDWFFAHAGDTGGRTIEQLNRDLRNGVEKDGFATLELVGKDSILEAPLRGRGLTPWIESRSPGANAAALGVSHLVQGHEPREIRFADGTIRNTGEMFQRDGVLFLVDTGMSKGVGHSTGAILHIQKKDGREAIALCADGTKTTIWDDKSNPAIGQAAPCGQ
jgi:Calcineurin-like phosphoesterase